MATPLFQPWLILKTLSLTTSLWLQLRPLFSSVRNWLRQVSTKLWLLMSSNLFSKIVPVILSKQLVIQLMVVLPLVNFTLIRQELTLILLKKLRELTKISSMMVWKQLSGLQWHEMVMLWYQQLLIQKILFSITMWKTCNQLRPNSNWPRFLQVVTSKMVSLVSFSRTTRVMLSKQWPIMHKETLVLKILSTTNQVFTTTLLKKSRAMKLTWFMITWWLNSRWPLLRL